MRALLVCLLVCTGCVSSLPEIRSLQNTLRERIHEAKYLGAMECAPQRLAEAQLAFRFGSLEIDQGDMARAQAHLEQGLESAGHALDLGPRCLARGADNLDWSVDPWDDADGDAVKDADDRCPASAEDQDGFQDGDGCPESDNDLDGVDDPVDLCPDQPEDQDGWLDEDGCPDPDNDGDLIADLEDGCPDQAETPNGFEDGDGCPDVNAELVDVRANALHFAEKIHFVERSPILLPQSFLPLREAARVLIASPSARIRIDVHTDNLGDVGELLELSHSRAVSVLEFLAQEGVERTRLTVQGFGGETPVDTNRTEIGRAANNRVVLSVLSGALKI
jgi:OOP family OmpA-OmpF porin